MIAERLSIERRFCGPPQSGNGGYVCGRMAKHLRGPVAARLHAPPPLETELRIEASEDEARLSHEDRLVAAARHAALDFEAPLPPTFASAERASAGYIGFTHHALPTCFVCGPQRAGGDGLCIFPGRVGDGPIYAAPWIPDASLSDGVRHVAREFLWAALDCIGAFANLAPDGKMMLLGELCARIDRDVVPGERCVVVGWALGIEGRKRYSGTAVFGESGALAGVARTTWIELASAPAGR